MVDQQNLASLIISIIILIIVIVLIIIVCCGYNNNNNNNNQPYVQNPQAAALAAALAYKQKNNYFNPPGNCSPNWYTPKYGSSQCCGVSDCVPCNADGGTKCQDGYCKAQVDEC